MSFKARIVATAVGLVLILLAHGSYLDRYTLDVTEQGIARALTTFGVSRTLNGVISVVQGTEVAVEPVGVGMTFTPGQILDPINDLIERFSTVVLIAATAFGIQKTALEVSSASVYAWITTITVLIVLLMLWWPKRVPRGVFTFTAKLAAVLIIIRFAIPSFVLAGELFYQQFLAPQYEASSAELDLTSERLSEIHEQNQAENRNLPDEQATVIEKAKNWFSSASESIDVKGYLDRFKNAAETISENTIRIMVVFIFQTTILPMLSVWLSYKLIQVVIFHRWRESA